MGGDRGIPGEDKTRIQELAGGHEMGAERTLALIDTNVFVIDLRYRQDTHYRANRMFLDAMGAAGTGFTTIVNLLEICGILSFNLNDRQLRELWVYFEQKYRVTVLPDTGLDATLPSLKIREVFEWIKKKLSFRDAYILAVALKQIPSLSLMITWDKEHFKGKFGGLLCTPTEYLQNRPQTDGCI
jgi:predicted nucleic acid-binding protein